MPIDVGGVMVTLTVEQAADAFQEALRALDETDDMPSNAPFYNGELGVALIRLEEAMVLVRRVQIRKAQEQGLKNAV